MKNKFIIIFPLLIITLFSLAALEGWFSYFIFPAVAVMLYYLAAFEGQNRGNKIIIIGFCLFIIFNLWQYIFKGDLEVVRSLIYTIIILGAFEAWHFTSYTSPNVWGLMNLVVFYISLEYLMTQWLPFDIKQWILGAPFLNDELVTSWVLYVGYQGITLWIWLVSLLFYNSFRAQLNFIPLLIGLLILIIPLAFNPGISEDTSLYAQGEWIGRTSIWISILIVVYALVKRKTTT